MTGCARPTLARVPRFDKRVVKVKCFSYLSYKWSLGTKSSIEINLKQFLEAVVRLVITAPLILLFIIQKNCRLKPLSRLCLQSETRKSPLCSDFLAFCFIVNLLMDQDRNDASTFSAALRPSRMPQITRLGPRLASPATVPVHCW